MKKYFEDNVISYTYLFFASAATVAYRGYYLEALKRPEKIYPNLAIALWQLLSPLLVVFFFLAGSLSTYKLNNMDKWNKFWWWGIHLLICTLIVVFTPIGS